MLTGGSGEPSPSGSPAPSPSAAQVAVPSFVNLAFADAQAQAEALGLTVTRAATEENTDVAPDTVLSQDPAEGVSVPAGTEIKLTVARGPTAVAVPDVRDKAESEALQLIVAQGLTVGTRTTAFDPTIVLGNVVSQSPGAGIIVAPGTPVDYVVSEGPEPTPTPTVVPTATPTPPPTATPTPKPTPTPTPPPANVGIYTCMTLEEATTKIDADGFAMGTVTSDPAGTDPVPTTWIVTQQDPTPGQKVPAGTAINLVAMDPSGNTGCP
jgi:beta-lactam-binding protein with PASTA domain